MNPMNLCIYHQKSKRRAWLSVHVPRWSSSQSVALLEPESDHRHTYKIAEISPRCDRDGVARSRERLPAHLKIAEILPRCDRDVPSAHLALGARDLRARDHISAISHLRSRRYYSALDLGEIAISAMNLGAPRARRAYCGALSSPRSWSEVASEPTR